MEQTAAICVYKYKENFRRQLYEITSTEKASDGIAAKRPIALV